MKPASVLVLLASASACWHGSTGAKIGGVAGGAVAGPVGEVGGAIVGGMVEDIVDDDDDDKPISKDSRPIAFALETNQQVQWSNPQTGYRYQIDPMGTYNQGEKQCREFRMLTQPPGQVQPQVVFGTACRGRNGTWGQPNQG